MGDRTYASHVLDAWSQTCRMQPPILQGVLYGHWIAAKFSRNLTEENNGRERTGTRRRLVHCKSVASNTVTFLFHDSAYYTGTRVSLLRTSCMLRHNRPSWFSCVSTPMHGYSLYTQIGKVRLKTRDLTTRHRIAVVDIARLVWMCEYICSSEVFFRYKRYYMNRNSTKSSKYVTK